MEHYTITSQQNLPNTLQSNPLQIVRSPLFLIHSFSNGVWWRAVPLHLRTVMTLLQKWKTDTSRDATQFLPLLQP